MQDPFLEEFSCNFEWIQRSKINLHLQVNLTLNFSWQLSLIHNLPNTLFFHKLQIHFYIIFLMPHFSHAVCTCTTYCFDCFHTVYTKICLSWSIWWWNVFNWIIMHFEGNRENWNLGVWIALPTGCNHFQCTVHFFLDLVKRFGILFKKFFYIVFLL